jgi:hypothetical protein
MRRRHGHEQGIAALDGRFKSNAVAGTYDLRPVDKQVTR